MAKIKKGVSILLAIIMILSVFTILPISVSAAGDYVVIGISSDVHSNTTGLADWMSSVQDTAGDFDVMLFCGDYVHYGLYGNSYYNGGTYQNATYKGFKDVKATAEAGIKWNDTSKLKAVYTSGNHDWQSTMSNSYSGTPGLSSDVTKDGGIKQKGAVEDSKLVNSEYYGVYCFGAASNYDDGKEEFVQADIDDLDAYLKTLDTTKPIFILSHFPLHYISNRTIKNADKVIDVLNNYPSLNLYFLWGHNHSKVKDGTETHYGQVVEKGGTIDYASGSSKYINFTYTNAGGLRDYETDANNVSGAVATISKSDGSVSIRYYDYRDGSDVTPAASGESEFSYQLVSGNTLEDGGKYLIVSTNAAGDGKALKKYSDSVSNAATTSNAASVTVIASGSDKLITSGVSDDMIWTVSASNGKYTLKNGNSYLFCDASKTNSTTRKQRLGFSTTSTAWTYTSANVLQDASVTADNYKYFYYSDSNSYFRVGSSTNTVYFYKQVEAVPVEPPTLYTVTTSVGEGGSVSPTSAVVTSGSSASFTITPDDGYELETLTDNGTDKTSSVSGNTYTINSVTADHAISVTFKALPATIYELVDSFTANKEYLIVNKNTAGEAYAVKNDSSSNAQKVTIASDGTISVTDTSKISWTRNSSNNLKIGSTYLSRSSGSNLAFSTTARAWTYTSSNYLQTSGSSSTYTLYCNNSNSYALSNSTSGSTNNYKTYLYEKVDTPTVKYTVTPTAGEGGSITPNTATQVKEGESASFTITPNEGYEIDTVTVDGTAIELSELDEGVYTFTNVSQDHSIAATFKALPVYTITATAGEGGSIDPSGEKEVYGGESVSFTITPAEGYIIGSVTDNSAAVSLSGSTYTIENINEAHTVSVAFRQIYTGDADPLYKLLDYANGEGFVDGGKYLLVGPNGDKTTYYAAKNTSSGSGTNTTIGSTTVYESTTAAEPPESITTSDTDIVWDAQQNQSGYNLYNSSAAKYLEASNSGSNGAIGLVSTLANPSKSWTYEYEMSTEDQSGKTPAEAPFLYYHYDSSNSYVFYFSESNEVFKVYKGNRYSRRVYLYELVNGTVTFKNGEEELQSAVVPGGKIPVYSGATPTKDADDENIYTFMGWSDGTTTYTGAIPAVAGDVTYTAVFEETPRISGHSISVAGDIGVNYYLSFTEEELDDGVTVDFKWTVNGNEKEYTYNLGEDGKDTEDGIRISCPVPIAEMTYPIATTITFNNGESTISEPYSVAAYAKQFLTDEEKAKYIAKHSDDDNPEQDYNNYAYLVKTMLSYGARAQEHFDRDKDNLADKDITFGNEGTNPATEVDPEQIVTGASDMSAGLEAYGLEYKGSTVVFLSETSLRHYYRVVDQEKFDLVKDDITFGGKYVDLITKANGDTYFELANIAAPNIDKLYTLHIGATDYNYSVLAYVKAILNSSQPETMKALATATYWYNKAADVCFPN